MSTKIYDGYRLNLKDMSIKGILSWLNGPVTNTLERAIKSEIVERIKVDTETYRRNYHNLAKAVRDDKRLGRISYLDFGFEIVLMDGNLENELLCIVFSGSKAAKKAFAELQGVTYFGYWDNVDAEEGVSDKDWAARGKAWDWALGKLPIPSRVGLTHVVYPDYTIPFPDEYDEIYKLFNREA